MIFYRILKSTLPSVHHYLNDYVELRSYPAIIRHGWDLLTFDLRHNIKTNYRIDVSQLGFNDVAVQQKARRYRASSVISIEESLRFLTDSDRTLKEASLVDYGCGAGKVLFVGANAGLKSCHGVELSPKLVEQCQQNISNFRSNASIYVHNVNALDFIIPEDARIFYFFFPFEQEIFDQVIEKIFTHRKLTEKDSYLIIYNSPYNLSPYPLQKINHCYGATTYKLDLPGS